MLSAYAAQQHGPLLLMWAGQDKHIDAAKPNKVAEFLREWEKVYTQVEFSYAEHGFFCEERASYNADAASEAWALLAVFLKNKLQQA